MESKIGLRSYQDIPEKDCRPFHTPKRCAGCEFTINNERTMVLVDGEWFCDDCKKEEDDEN